MNDIDEVKTLIHEVSWSLQTLTNRSGYSPAQRVLGKQPALNMDNLANMSEYEVTMTSDASWKKAEEIRQTARQALMMVDSRERLQRAARARPRRAREKHVFQEGEPVYVWRQGRRGFQAKRLDPASSFSKEEIQCGSQDEENSGNAIGAKSFPWATSRSKDSRSFRWSSSEPKKS